MRRSICQMCIWKVSTDNLNIRWCSVYIYIYYWNMTISGILSRSAAKNQIACIRLFKNNYADYIQCSSSLLCLPSEHQDCLLLNAAAQSGSEVQFSGAAHFYFPTGYYFPHSILEGYLRWHYCQGYQKLVPASDCAREERELVCLHVVLGDNIGLLVLPLRDRVDLLM